MIQTAGKKIIKGETRNATMKTCEEGKLQCIGKSEKEATKTQSGTHEEPQETKEPRDHMTLMSNSE